MIAPFAALTFLRVHQMHHRMSCLAKNFAIYVVMAVLAALALVNIGLCIIVNALAVFWIAYLLIDEFNPNNYFPAGMALIFFQISPVNLTSAKGLLMRIAGLVAAFLIIAVFLSILRLCEKVSGKALQKNQLEQLVYNGMDLCAKICEKIETLLASDIQVSNVEKETDEIDDIQKLQHNLCQINRQLCQLLYTQNRSVIGKKVEDNRYCAYVALFQTASHIELHSGQNETIKNQIRQLKDLMQDYDQVIANLPDEVSKKLRIRTNRLDIRSFRLRFALRQVCVLTPCLVFAYVSGWPNSYWLTISVFFMMIPLYERTPGRIAQRMSGTLAGLMLCVILFAVFNGIPARIVLMTIFNFLIYCASDYASMVTFITGSALALNFVEDNYLVMLAQRLIYTIVGAVIAWIANTWIFPIRANRQMKFIRKILEEVRNEAENAIQLPRAQRVCTLNRLIILSYMLCMRMDDLNSTLQEEQKNHVLEHELQTHMQTLAGLIKEKIG